MHTHECYGEQAQTGFRGKLTGAGILLSLSRPQNGTQASRLGSKCFHQLSHLTISEIRFLREESTQHRKVKCLDTF